MDVYARRRLVAAGGGVLVLILIIFGISQCGDDDEAPITPIGATGGATLTAPSKDDFISEADSICSEANAALISADEDEADDPVQLASDRYDIVNNQLSELQGLAPPEKDADLLDDFFSTLQDRVRALRKLNLATERQDDAAAGEAQAEVDAANTEVSTAAQEFGFEICGTSEGGDAQTQPGTGTDTGGTAPAPATPTTPAPTTPAPTTPPDTGDGDGDSGGVGPG